MGDSFSLIQKSFKDSVFRDITDRIIIVLNKEIIVRSFGNTSVTKNLNGLIGYCYIDYTEGISFQPCAAVSAGEDWLKLKDLPNYETMYVYRFRDNEISNSYRQGEKTMELYNIPEDALIMYPENLNMDMSMFDAFIERFTHYAPSEEVAHIRELKHLDPFRNDLYPDDLRVLLYREGKDIEQVWVRTMFLSEHTMFGKLLNEPYGDLDFHKGEIIEFQMIQSGEDENNRVLVATGRKAELVES
ncbi:MAG: hypothetical protein ACI4EX_00630 [Lachnospiraceae bacterium]